MVKISSQEKRVYQSLSNVLDPELGISIVDLGLIYKVAPKVDEIIVIMTLTTIGCPLFPLIESQVKEALKKIGYKKIRVKLIFDPPWSMERMTETGRAHLGI